MKNILQDQRFIGFHYSNYLKEKFKVGIDNINNYYDKKIKYDDLVF